MAMASASPGRPFSHLFLCSVLIFLSAGSSARSSYDPRQPYRTGYHFQPPKNWMNGALVYKGIYHLFYQWNPNGSVWGNIVWAHSTSADLVNWIPHKPAIYPTQQSDINGCWSGSATILRDGDPAILYTGIDPENKQVQNLATPKNLSDPYLVEWVKSPNNPVMAPTRQNRINASSFRDPTTAWRGRDGLYRAIIGSKRDRLGLAILFKSVDFVHWVEAREPLHSVPGNGMWECPDFYPVRKRGSRGVDTSTVGPRVKHVLKLSLDETRHDTYTIGRYDTWSDRYVPDKGSVESDAGFRYDYGKFYASKTFYDSLKRRRVLWGWINESSSTADDIKKGWSGIQAVPRSVWLDKSGKQLIQWPIAEIESLRTGHVESSSKLLKPGSLLPISNITATQADVEVSFRVRQLEKAEELDPRWSSPQLICSRNGASPQGGLGPFGLLVLASDDLEEYTAVFFRVFKARSKYVVLMCSDQSRSSLDKENDKTTYGAFLDVDPRHEELSLRSLIDHSIVESFGGKGKVCITSRVYPTKAVGGKAKVYAFNNGEQSVEVSKLSAWSMERAQINLFKP
uniref:Beta-fructofuranosidase n=1 Tax=Kalanchoe fedtschenkoi TaxID=63787 RepID=A0A7N0ZYB8_KALFE